MVVVVQIVIVQQHLFVTKRTEALQEAVEITCVKQSQVVRVQHLPLQHPEPLFRLEHLIHAMELVEVIVIARAVIYATTASVESLSAQAAQVVRVPVHLRPQPQVSQVKQANLNSPSLEPIGQHMREWDWEYL